MKKIKMLVDEINDELESAKTYAEERVDYKVRRDPNWASRFEEMAYDELKHAGYLHDLVASDISALREVYTPPEDMLDKWNKAHAKYVEKAAWIKQMLLL